MGMEKCWSFSGCMNLPPGARCGGSACCSLPRTAGQAACCDLRAADLAWCPSPISVLTSSAGKPQCSSSDTSSSPSSFPQLCFVSCDFDHILKKKTHTHPKPAFPQAFPGQRYFSAAKVSDVPSRCPILGPSPAPAPSAGGCAGAPFNPLATLAVGGNVSGEGEEISVPSLCCAIPMSAEAPSSTSSPFPEAK